MRPATFASVLLRAHLRKLTTLPRTNCSPLSAASASSPRSAATSTEFQGPSTKAPKRRPLVREEFRAMLKICEALRDNTKGY